MMEKIDEGLDFKLWVTKGLSSMKTEDSAKFLQRKQIKLKILGYNDFTIEEELRRNKS